MMIKKKRTRNISSRRRTHGWRPWHFLVIAGVIFLSYIFLFSNHGLIRYYQLVRRREKLIKQIDVLKQEQINLQKEIDMLTNNYRYIEKIAREKYQMGKPGEKIYLMTTPGGKNRN